jgi:WD40 repeat protein
MLFAAHASRVRALAFSIEHGRLASVGEDRVLRLWETGTLRELGAYAFDAHMDSETFGVSLAFSHDGRLMAAGSWDCIRCGISVRGASCADWTGCPRLARSDSPPMAGNW